MNGAMETDNGGYEDGRRHANAYNEERQCRRRFRLAAVGERC